VNDSSSSGGGGVLVARWETLRIPAGGLVIRLGPAGPQLDPIVVELALEMWPHWFEVALRHAKDARESHRLLLEAHAAQAAGAVQRLDDEMQSSMQCITAMAFAVDALYGSLVERVNVPAPTRAAWARNRTARRARVLEVIRTASKLRNDQVHGMKTVLISLFQFRDWAVHPPADFRQPVLHPDLQAGVDRRFIVFSSANADRAVMGGLEVVVRTIDNHKDTAALREWCPPQRRILDDLLHAAGITYADASP
jgi:hypothetical protein